MPWSQALKANGAQRDQSLGRLKAWIASVNIGDTNTTGSATSASTQFELELAEIGGAINVDGACN